MILDSLMLQLRQSVARGESRTLTCYHLGRVQGYSYSMPYASIEATAAQNEAKFLVNSYAERHGGNNDLR